MIDLNKPCEGIDYQITNIELVNDEQAWQASIIRGRYADHNLVFTEIEYNGKTQQLKFKLDVVVDNLLVAADLDLQNFAFDLLTDIIKNGIANGSLILDDKNTDN